METETEDSKLMAKIAGGDKSAMKLLVDRYKEKAYYLALGMVGNSDEAYDVSQDAFIRVYRSAKKFHSGSRFFPWFYSIIANLCKDVLARRMKKEVPNIDIDDCEFLLAEEGNPESVVLEKEQARMVRKAIMKLPLEDREIIMLKHFRDMSYDQIAALLNIPKGTVMSRLYYARKKLAAMLEEFD